MPQDNYAYETFSDTIVVCEMRGNCRTAVGFNGVYVLSGTYKMLGGGRYLPGTVLHPWGVRHFLLDEILKVYPQYATNDVRTAADKQDEQLAKLRK